MRIHPRWLARQDPMRHAAGRGELAPGVMTQQQRKGSDMTGARCTCGFTEAASEDYTIGDHLYEMFAPGDGKGPDGLVHLEGEKDLFCMCGAGGSTQKLDAHFLDVFTPSDLVSRDGRKHERVAG
jgi:hypothetical protein